MIALVKGRVRYALYDFKTGAVFSLNFLGMMIIYYLRNRISNPWIICSLLSSLEGKPIYSSEDYKNVVEYLNHFSDIGLMDRIDEIQELDLETKKSHSSEEMKLNFAWCELTHECNLRCLHCYADAGTKEVNELSIEKWKNIISQLVQAGVTSIQFTGGEIFLVRELLWQLVDFAISLGVEDIELYTNLTLLNQIDINNIISKKVRVATTILGSCSEVHDSITQNHGSFDKTIAAIKSLLEKEIKLRVAVIEMMQNENDIEKIYQLLESVGVRNYRNADQVRSAGRVNREMMSTKKINNSLAFIANKEAFERNKIWNPCWAFKFAINSRGDVMPCVFTRNLKIGNVNSVSVLDIISSLQKYWKITKDQIDVCCDCEYKYLCFDCRAIPTNEGNLYGKCARCDYDPNRVE